MTSRIVVDHDRCELAGECVYNHPEYFAWNSSDDGIVVRRPVIESDDDQRAAEQAVSMCPAGAISIVE